METIFDIGANNGDDSYFYLQKGFRVIGVEANPSLCDDLRKRFEAEILNKQFVLIEKAIVADETVSFVDFFINQRNSHWSSIFSHYGEREGGSVRVEIPTITASSLLRSYGVPYYMKVDVEGMDIEIVKALKKFKKPKYVSIEEFQGVRCLEALLDAGFNRFKLVSQRVKNPAEAPFPSLEGHYFAKTFTGEDSGCFGKELAGNWLNFDHAVNFMRKFIRGDDGVWVGEEGEWFDVHATQSLWKRALGHLRF